MGCTTVKKTPLSGCKHIAHLLTYLIVILAIMQSQCKAELNEDAETQLRVGRSVDIFVRYGYLSLSMKVVPRANDNISFLFREPTIEIFNGLEKFIHFSNASIPTIPQKRLKDASRSKRPPVFQGDFHMEFCDNIRQLDQAYFRDYSFEGLQTSWRAFTGSWTTETLAKNLGINSSFIRGEHCFVLVRLARYRENAKLSRMPNNIDLVKIVAKEIENIHVGNASAVLTFIRKYGSHYIHSYTTGNSLYQVFVFRKSIYLRIKERLKTQGISKLDNLELEQYFSPWYAEHIGQIKVASGNKTVERWAHQTLSVNYYIFSYQTLLKIYGNTHLLGVLNQLLTNEAILEMDMKTIAPAFKDPVKRAWFEQILDNNLKLWESNL